MKRTIVLLSLLMAIVIAAGSAECAQKIAVIVNSTGPLTALSEGDIRDIYLGEKKFVSGIKVMPIHMAEGPVKAAFLMEIVKLSPAQYKLHWTKKVFQEGLAMPTFRGRSVDILGAVAAEKGAIGYVPQEDASEGKGIKVITTITH